MPENSDSVGCTFESCLAYQMHPYPNTSFGCTYLSQQMQCCIRIGKGAKRNVPGIGAYLLFFNRLTRAHILIIEDNADMAAIERDDLTLAGFDVQIEMGDNITVAVHIGRIRDKMEDDPANPRLLQTVWGVGYRFNKEVQRICGFFMHLGLRCLRD